MEIDFLEKLPTVFLRKLNARFKIEEYNARMCFDYVDFSSKWANYMSRFKTLNTKFIEVHNTDVFYKLLMLPYAIACYSLVIVLIH